MRRGRKTKRAYLLSMLLLGAGLVVAQGRWARAVPNGQGEGTRPEEKEKIDKGRMVFGESCVQCHTMDAVLIQRKPAGEWRETVYSMISRGALLTPDEIEPLIGYLSAAYGPHSPAPQANSGPRRTTAGARAGEDSLPAGEGRQILSRTCVKCHDLSLVTASRKSEDEWVKTIARMVSYGTSLQPSEQQTLVRYLARNLGGKND